MIKFLCASLILFLILFTAFIKNSTKRIDDEIFIVKENIRELKKDFEKTKLENNFLSSTEKLADFKSYAISTFFYDPSKLLFGNETIQNNNYFHP